MKPNNIITILRTARDLTIALILSHMANLRKVTLAYYWRAWRIASFNAFLFILLVGSNGAHANLITKTDFINDIGVTVRTAPNGPDTFIDLGNMSISLADAGASSVMNAAFTANADASWVLGDLNLHWLQLIWNGNQLARYNNVYPPLPVIDPPNGGWDYMYLDGAGRTQPNNAIPDYGSFIDGLPWYWNSVGEANSTSGLSYSMVDVPGDRTAPDYIGFSTYLVATDHKLCNAAPGCLAANDILLLAGFYWTANNTDIEILPESFKGPSPYDVGVITDSLGNAGFNGWNVTDSKAALVPEPPTFLLLLLGMAPLLFVRRSMHCVIFRALRCCP